ncbi:hypothetical protein [Algibacter pectinivorans]|uniref:Patatin-like phospholipase n=1 Tax=Algibacter pectinivorans TaxID=870482 RepID=A0A1I1RZS0_9FLAO|nr:hypothetical protein [Algibacter pectinivorans]SFD39814.1 hypothetical protein SAMN04487987_11250 [Algibacter pectinivorans]
METNQKNKTSFSQWLKYLIQAIIKHAFPLVFVFVLFVIFRMPHLSDLTIVIIQLQDHNDFIVMPIFYTSILVMGLLISYGNLIKIESVKKSFKAEADGSIVAKDIKLRRKVVKAINPKDSKEISIEKSNVSIKPSGQIDTKIIDESVEDPKIYVERMYTKILGIFMILSITFSVENTYYQLFGEYITFKYFFLLLTLFLVAITNPRLGMFLKGVLKWKSNRKWLPIIIVAISFAIILILGFANIGGTEQDIKNLFWSMACLSVLFFVFSISYNEKILWFKENYGIPLAYLFTFSMVLMYIVMLIDPELHYLKYLTPMVIIMVCIIGQYTIFLGLNLYGKRKKWPILTIVFFGSILMTVFVAKSNCFTHYEVSTVDSENIHPDSRLNLETYVDQYILERRQDILNATCKAPFPIVLVSAEGGGSRAGLWAFLVHSYLYGKNENYFKKHLFSITGASGGSVGSNMFYIQAYANKDSYQNNLFLAQESDSILNENDFNYKASVFYQKDYISSSVAGLLGRDIVASILHLNFYRDRGKITETEWEATFDDLFNVGLLKRPYLDIMPKKGDTFTPPIMVTTTTHVQTGQLYLMSPVKFNTTKPRESGFNDLLSEYAKKNESSKMIKRSAAMLLTARFPYLSPNGRVSGIGQFGDGGYYDNIGGTVTNYLEAALIKGLTKDSLLQGKYKIKHLIITNNSEAESKNEAIDYYSQLTTPAQMAVNAIFAHADEFINSHPDCYRLESKRTALQNPENDRLFKPLIPLGRYLSIDAVRSLEERLKDSSEVVKKLDKLLKFE